MAVVHLMLASAMEGQLEDCIVLLHSNIQVSPFLFLQSLMTNNEVNVLCIANVCVCVCVCVCMCASAPRF